MVADPRIFWFIIAFIYASGSIVALVKCFHEGWTLQNIAQVGMLACSSISNFLFGIILNSK